MPNKMKKIKTIIILFVCLTLFIYACKKEEINNQEFVQEHFIGKWPLKSHVEITLKNGDTLKKDTILFSPIDTLLFTAEGKYTKRNVSANYAIDADGENLNISTAPPINWKIKFLRNTSIILTQTRTEKIGSDTFTYYVEEQLIK
jgi:hypothetical protein